MKEADLLQYSPPLWHMTDDRSWESIRKHGLLTSGLLDLHGVDGAERALIESGRRPESVWIATKRNSTERRSVTTSH